MLKPPGKVLKKKKEAPIAAGNLRIVSDGTANGTRIEHWNGDKYERLSYVTGIEWKIDASDGLARCNLHLVKVPVNVVAKNFSETTQ